MKTVIGIIGTIGAGKDTAAECIAQELSIPRFSVSDPLKERAAQQGIELTRENLVALGRTLAEEEGQEYLARTLLGKIPEVGIISGMRQLAQIEYLREYSNFFLIAIDAEPAIRFSRVRERRDVTEALTLEEFIQNEHAENTGTVQQLFKCMELADIHIPNNGTISEFESNVRSVLQALDHA